MSAVEKAALAVTIPAIGQAYGGGFVTGITRDPATGKRSLHITAGAAHELVGKWGEYGKKIEGADSYSDGEANTRAMAEAGSVIAMKALELDGFIPSCLEGQLLMAAKADGLVELREDRYHWLSSQRSADYAYSMDFVDGWLSRYGKFHEQLARPVRSLPIQ